MSGRTDPNVPPWPAEESLGDDPWAGCWPSCRDKGMAREVRAAALGLVIGAAGALLVYVLGRVLAG